MSRRRFAFEGTLWVPADRARVHAVMVDLGHYVDWWPEIRAIAALGPEDALVVCRSVLPYDLELRLHAVDRSAERLFVTVDGPFHGWVEWRLAERPGGTRIDYRQEVVVTAPGLSIGSYLIKPVLRWNHERMMRGAERGLRRRLTTGD